ncbi:hypothetical protein OUZ56_032305 [Daphnia magna]|uniref:Uncharacterized protein n=1 Tax=Daphnia magna TaxID=35525 RepID=A0ABQ9ZWU3_9CRUS|nr:hypothetical protein OUZ56_032305 [Daphnia magna]
MDLLIQNTDEMIFVILVWKRYNRPSPSVTQWLEEIAPVQPDDWLGKRRNVSGAAANRTKQEDCSNQP